MTAPEPVARRAARLGEPGRAWLAGLPDLVTELAGRWAVTVGDVLGGGHGSWVARVRRADGTPAVLKIALPDGSSADEVAVLSAAAGRGYVRVLAADPAHRALLLEHLGPSLDRSGLAPEAQLAVLGDVLRAAWLVDAPSVAPRDIAAELARDVPLWWAELGRPCPERLVDRALECAARRGADRSRVAVVHGDPHPGNALRRGGDHVLIDPVGFVADPAYDLGVALRDWCPQLLAAPDAAALVARYAGVLADRTGVDGTAIAEWGFLERVSSGLYLLLLGWDEEGRRFLDSAERLTG